MLKILLSRFPTRQNFEISVQIDLHFYVFAIFILFQFVYTNPCLSQ